MRIIGGTKKGRKFHPPSGIPTRPTTDFAKEGLFNILSNYFNFENVSFLDLFAGTGSHSYEFASRGCKQIRSVELFPKCVRFIERTAEQLEFDAISVTRLDVFKFLETNRVQYDLIFAGPPYGLETLATIPDVIFEKNTLAGKGWFIMEHNPNHNFEQHPNFRDSRNYGKTIFSIFENK